MPKTIIEFNEEEQHEATIALNGWRYHSALWEFKNYLRSELKYAEHTEEEYKILEEVQDNFFRILTEFKAHLEWAEDVLIMTSIKLVTLRMR